MITGIIFIGKRKIKRGTWVRGKLIHTAKVVFLQTEAVEDLLSYDHRRLVALVVVVSLSYWWQRC